MAFRTLISYLTEYHKREEIEKAKENYTNTLIYGLYQLTYAKAHEGRGNDKVKTFAELLDILEGKNKVDTRSAEEIQEDILSKFRGTAGQ